MFMASSEDCPFCTLPSARIVAERDTAYMIRDGFPVTPGHSLAIPKRHIGSWFDATDAERRDLMALIDEARAQVLTEFKPDAWNIGINDGPAAGQTVPHLHVHLIPRYKGDVADPRGGVRWVIPNKADYWSGKRGG
jgi:diadenosine tetraphosphate (Ap4A) HIT family hydrolase